MLTRRSEFAYVASWRFLAVTVPYPSLATYANQLSWNDMNTAVIRKGFVITTRKVKGRYILLEIAEEARVTHRTPVWWNPGLWQCDIAPRGWRGRGRRWGSRSQERSSHSGQDSRQADIAGIEVSPKPYYTETLTHVYVILR